MNTTTSFSTKQFRELGNNVHEKLYDNIKLLTCVCPTTKQFNEVFKPQMFVKSNKAAFQHVIYYLFDVINHELTKEKITAWPLYEIKQESAFRGEVVAFINHLHNTYEYANIPTVNGSHLMTPGGLRFAKLMLKLSILAMHENLKREKVVCAEVTAPIKPHKDQNLANIVTKNLKAQIKSLENNVQQPLQRFHDDCHKSREEAELLVQEQAKYQKLLAQTNKKIKDKENTEVAAVSVKAIVSKLENLKERMSVMEKSKFLSSQCRELFVYLTSDEAILEFRKEEFVVPNCVKSFCKSDELDLCNLFESMRIALENQYLDLPVFEKSQLNEMVTFVDDLNQKFVQVEQRLNLRQSQLVEITECLFSELNSKKTCSNGIKTLQ